MQGHEEEVLEEGKVQEYMELRTQEEKKEEEAEERAQEEEDMQE